MASKIAINENEQDACNEYDDCNSCTSQSSCGWCPSSSICYTGDETGPTGATCVATQADGGWTWHNSDCQCLTASNCSECMVAGNCGWCPSLGKCYIGSADGPSYDLVCGAVEEYGAWTWYSDDCECLTASSCSECMSAGNCGWCPAKQKCWMGDSTGPANNFQCPAEEEYGAWTWYASDCQCLTAANCSDCMAAGNCGWCPSKGKCWMGSSDGPYNDFECPAVEEYGAWTWYTSDCECLTANTCSDCMSAGNCGWCPSKGTCWMGGATGPGYNFTCPADEELGQWTWYTEDCECLVAETCSDCMNAGNCGWCGSNGKCYIGSSSGPDAPLTCGAWTWYSDQCAAGAKKPTKIPSSKLRVNP